MCLTEWVCLIPWAHLSAQACRTAWVCLVWVCSISLGVPVKRAPSFTCLSMAVLFLFPPLRSNCRVLLMAVSPVLGTLLYQCLLHGTRNLAYRTSRFLRLCLRCVLGAVWGV